MKSPPTLLAVGLLAAALLTACGTTTSRTSSDPSVVDARPPPSEPSAPEHGVDAASVAVDEVKAPVPNVVAGSGRARVEHCQTVGAPSQRSTRLCLEVIAGQTPPSFTLVLEDEGRLDPATGEKVTATRASFPMLRGELAGLGQARWLELDASTRLGLVPLIRPAPRADDEMRSTAVVLVDLVSGTVQDLGRTPWCRGCDGISTRGVSERGMLRTVEVIAYDADGGFVEVQRTIVRWDGSRIDVSHP